MEGDIKELDKGQWYVANDNINMTVFFADNYVWGAFRPDNHGLKKLVFPKGGKFQTSNDEPHTTYWHSGGIPIEEGRTIRIEFPKAVGALGDGDDGQHMIDYYVKPNHDKNSLNPLSDTDKRMEWVEYEREKEERLAAETAAEAEAVAKAKAEAEATTAKAEAEAVAAAAKAKAKAGSSSGARLKERALDMSNERDKRDCMTVADRELRGAKNETEKKKVDDKKNECLRKLEGVGGGAQAKAKADAERVEAERVKEIEKKRAIDEAKNMEKGGAWA